VLLLFQKEAEVGGYHLRQEYSIQAAQRMGGGELAHGESGRSQCATLFGFCHGLSLGLTL
jgi:hypothetical protein